MPKASRVVYAARQNAKRKAARLVATRCDSSAYVPWDETVTHPRVRVLRMIAVHDWFAAHDLTREILGVWDQTERNRHDQQIARMIAAGWLVSRKVQLHGFGGTEYAITAAGRAELARMLARAVVPEPLETDCVTCVSRPAVQDGECRACARRAA